MLGEWGGRFSRAQEKGPGGPVVGGEVHRGQHCMVTARQAAQEFGVFLIITRGLRVFLRKGMIQSDLF